MIGVRRYFWSSLKSDPTEMLKQAKNLLEQGLISQDIFDDIQQKVLYKLEIETNPNPSNKEKSRRCCTNRK